MVMVGCAPKAPASMVKKPVTIFGPIDGDVARIGPRFCWTYKLAFPPPRSSAFVRMCPIRLWRVPASLTRCSGQRPPECATHPGARVPQKEPAPGPSDHRDYFAFMRTNSSHFMHTGSVLLLSLMAAALLGLCVFWITVFIHQQIFPPVVVVNGIEHRVMPTASLLSGLIFGLVAAVGTFVFASRRLDKR